MTIKTVELIPPSQIIDNLRNVNMMHNREAYPYRDSKFSFEEMPLDNIRPTQLYVLKEHLKIQHDLRTELLSHGIDTLRMLGVIAIRGTDEYIMMPPIVEEDIEHGSCLLDGTHRAYYARQLGAKSLGVLHIYNVDKSLPMTALPNDWEEIIEYNDIPIDKSLKKYYRELDGEKYQFYRDFAEITGVSKDPRSEIETISNVK